MLLSVPCLAELRDIPGTNPLLRVSDQHPRLLVNSEVQRELRCRAGLGDSAACTEFGNAAAVFEAVKDNIDDDFNDGKKTESHIDQYAFLYLMTGSGSYCDLAVEGALEIIAARDCDSNPSSCDSESYGFGRIGTVALVYDWCFARLSSAQKAVFQDDILGHMLLNPVADSHERYPHAETIAFSFSIFADVNDARIAQHIAEHYSAFKDIFLPAAAEVACDGGFDGYSAKRTTSLIVGAEVFARASNYNMLSHPTLQNINRPYLARLRPDLEQMRVPGKWNPADEHLMAFASFAGARSADRVSQDFANTLAERGDYSGDYESFLWFDPARPAAPLEESDTTVRLRCSGMNYMRSKWELNGDASDAVQAAFYNGPDLVGHYTQNHMQISRGTDLLLIDAGLRRGDNDRSYYNYYTRSIAHNLVTIFDPGEDFGDDPSVYMDGFPKSNDGGQISGDYEEGCRRWPTACAAYRGELLKHEDSPDFSYFVGDATAAYRSHKTNRVVRNLVYLKNRDAFLVYDQVDVRSPAYKARVNLHMVERPQLDGTLNLEEGSFQHGGVFESQNSSLIQVREGKSQLLIKTLLPESPLTRVVGGQNCRGEPLRQTLWPQDGDSHSDCQSFEQYVDGVNYPAGPDYFDERDTYRRNEPRSNKTGDWRVEIESAPAGGLHHFLQVMQAGDGNQYVDDSASGFETSGHWDQGNIYDAVGAQRERFRRTTNAGRKATWNFSVPHSGLYEVQVWLPYPQKSDFATGKYKVFHAGGSSLVTKNQQLGKASWESLGTFQFNSGAARLELESQTGRNIADAARLVRAHGGIEPLESELVRSRDGNMLGTSVSGQLLMFSADASAQANVRLSSAIASNEDVVLFDMLPDTSFRVAWQGADLVIAPGQGPRSSANGVLRFGLAGIGGDVWTPTPTPTRTPTQPGDSGGDETPQPTPTPTVGPQPTTTPTYTPTHFPTPRGPDSENDGDETELPEDEVFTPSPKTRPDAPRLVLLQGTRQLKFQNFLDSVYEVRIRGRKVKKSDARRSVRIRAEDWKLLLFPLELDEGLYTARYRAAFQVESRRGKLRTRRTRWSRPLRFQIVSD